MTSTFEAAKWALNSARKPSRRLTSYTQHTQMPGLTSKTSRDERSFWFCSKIHFVNGSVGSPVTSIARFTL